MLPIRFSLSLAGTVSVFSLLAQTAVPAFAQGNLATSTPFFRNTPTYRVISGDKADNIGGGTELKVDDRHVGGCLQIIDGTGVNRGLCPLKHTAYTSSVSGFVNRTTVEQTFSNPYSETIEAVYTFPLSNHAAVDEMNMQIGDRTIKGRIEKRDDARKAYEAARAEGRSAALLDQERTNIFTQQVANIPPHSTIKVIIKYTDLLEFKDGRYQMVLPMVVGPRYIGGTPTGASGSGQSPDTRTVPDGSKISPPHVLPMDRAGHDVSVTVDINGGLPISDVKSALHDVKVDAYGTSAKVNLKDEDKIPNRDFVLSWRVAKDELASGYLVHKDKGAAKGYFSLMMLPPARVKSEQVCPREINFILDRSGSQSGQPIQKAREAMIYIIDRLNPQDTFQVMSFSSGYDYLFTQPEPATAQNKEKARSYIAALDANGGTEMRQAVESIAVKPAPANRLRIFALMSDGYIGNETNIISLVKKTRDTSRWFTFGTGNSVNRMLIDGVAKAGGGEAEYVLLNSPGDKVAREFYEKLANPVFTDVKVSFKGFGNLHFEDVEPQVINDVWDERPVYVLGRYTGSGKGTVVMQGIAGGKRVEHTLPVDMPDAAAGNAVLPSVWARYKVDDLMDRMLTDAGRTGEDRESIKQEVEKLGLEHHIMTQYTSFVAIDDSDNKLRPANKSVTVPVEMPQGVTMGLNNGHISGAAIGGAFGALNRLPTINRFEKPLLDGAPISFEKLILGRHRSPRDTNMFQVEPTVVDERHYSSGRAERHQKTSPTLPEGAPIPDSDGAAAKPTPVTAQKQTAQNVPSQDNAKISVELAKSLTAWVKVADDKPTLQLQLTLKDLSPATLARLKALKLVDIKEIARTAATVEITATVPVRRISELAKIKEVIFMALAGKN